MDEYVVMVSNVQNWSNEIKFSNSNDEDSVFWTSVTTS